MAGEGGGGGGGGEALLASASMLFAIRRSLCFRVCCKIKNKKNKNKNRKKKKKEQTICDTDRLCTALMTTRRQGSIKITLKGLRQGTAGFSTSPSSFSFISYCFLGWSESHPGLGSTVRQIRNILIHEKVY